MIQQGKKLFSTQLGFAMVFAQGLCGDIKNVAAWVAL